MKACPKASASDACPMITSGATWHEQVRLYVHALPGQKNTDAVTSYRTGPAPQRDREHFFNVMWLTPFSHCKISQTDYYDYNWDLIQQLKECVMLDDQLEFIAMVQIPKITEKARVVDPNRKRRVPNFNRTVKTTTVLLCELIALQRHGRRWRRDRSTKSCGVETFRQAVVLVSQERLEELTLGLAERSRHCWCNEAVSKEDDEMQCEQPFARRVGGVLARSRISEIVATVLAARLHIAENEGLSNNIRQWYAFSEVPHTKVVTPCRRPLVKLGRRRTNEL